MAASIPPKIWSLFVAPTTARCIAVTSSWRAARLWRYASLTVTAPFTVATQHPWSPSFERMPFGHSEAWASAKPRCARHS
jgi:hypothetical protein